MDLPPLTLFMAASAAFAVGMYVVLDGFDLGIGILFPFAADPAERDAMMHSIAPFWDGNETWLVFGGAVLLSAFPLAFSVIMPAVYLPIIVMLLGLIFRGVAFEFRFKHTPRLRRWDWAFCGGSAIATFAQGVVLGAFVQGIEVRDGRYGGGPWDWLTTFSLMTGLALMSGYALLGATWLAWRAHGPVQAHARRWTPALLGGLLAGIAVVSIWTPVMSSAIAARWFAFPAALAFAPVPLLTVGCAWGIARSAKRTGSAQPFALTIGLFFLSFTGLAISLFPHLPPPSLTLADTAASPASQRFLAPGIAVLVPLILAHTWFNFRVFMHRGEHDPGYDH